LRSDVPARWRGPHLRRNDFRGKARAGRRARRARPVAPYPSLRAAGEGTVRSMSGADDPGFGVYLHWPFCAAKCPYCDFNSHVRQGGVDEERYAGAFARELAAMRQRTGPRRVTSIFLGGGTPSLMRPRTVAALIEAVARNWTVADAAEITLEANPGSADAERFRGYRAAGVNRLSLGVQALNDADLKFLGRVH